MAVYLLLYRLKVRVLLTFLSLAIFALSADCQTVVKMEQLNGVYVMPCKVNGLTLKFIIDTGASDVCISLTEALFMLKNGYLSKDDIIGTEYYTIANGDVEEGTKILIDSIIIGNIILKNVSASVIHSLKAPLLLGQSALSRLGRTEFNYSNNTLIIYGTTGNNRELEITEGISNNATSNYSNLQFKPENYMFTTTFKSFVYGLPLRDIPDVNGKVIYYCPMDALVYVVDNSGSVYYKVTVNGLTGYLSGIFLKK